MPSTSPRRAERQLVREPAEQSRVHAGADGEVGDRPSHAVTPSGQFADGQPGGALPATRSSCRSACRSCRAATVRMNPIPVVCGRVMTVGTVAVAIGVRGSAAARTRRDVSSRMLTSPISASESTAPKRIGALRGALLPVAKRNRTRAPAHFLVLLNTSNFAQ